MTLLGDASAHERMKRRLFALIDAVSDQLQPVTVELAREMINANEGPIAVEMLADMLVEAHALLPRAIVEEFEGVCSDLGLAGDTAERVRELVQPS